MMPLMRAIAHRLGENEVRYVYTQDLETGRQSLGWTEEARPVWALDARQHPECAREWLEDCPCLMSGCRDYDLFERRVKRQLVTFYSGERWFKQLPVFDGNCDLPGWLRLFSPNFFRMASRMRKLLRGKRPFYYLPDGIWAANDMLRLVNWLGCNFRPVHLSVRRTPGGVVQNRGRAFDRVRLWGYFVSPSTERLAQSCKRDAAALKILWVGRLLDWKCVDTVVRAVCVHADMNSHGRKPGMMLDVYGSGPMEESLKLLAKGHEEFICFHRTVEINKVRDLMREHDVYVLASNAREGWGAVTNEALEEGMHVLGTYEAGSSATMLDDKDLFHAGDWRRLQVLLERCLDEKQRSTLKGQGIGEWSAEKAAEKMVAFMNEVQGM